VPADHPAIRVDDLRFTYTGADVLHEIETIAPGAHQGAARGLRPLRRARPVAWKLLEIDDFQAARRFGVYEAVPVEPGLGWLLVLREQS
jgi:hypothetical protein